MAMALGSCRGRPRTQSCVSLKRRATLWAAGPDWSAGVSFLKGWGLGPSSAGHRRPVVGAQSISQMSRWIGEG